mmetsp:Transcript_8761/g.18657  ORF Transcript_8761/g.18657 Transcript_8761/m.18657 type:complete len:209 (-) Transcript_8761:158-784(-)
MRGCHCPRDEPRRASITAEARRRRCPFNINRADPIRVLTRFEHKRVALHFCERVVIVSAQNEIDSLHAARDLTVFKDGQMSHSHNKVHLLLAKKLDASAARIQNWVEFGACAGCRHDGSLWSADPKEAYTAPTAHSFYKAAFYGFERSVVVRDISRKPREVGFIHSLNEFIGAEIKFMVANDSGIDSHFIHNFHDDTTFCSFSKQAPT